MLGWYGRKTEVQQEFTKVIPENDPDYIEYHEFNKAFGHDGNVLLICFESDNPFRLDRINSLIEYTKLWKNINGVEHVINITTAQNLVRNDSGTKLINQPLIPQPLKNQAAADSIFEKLKQLPIYRNTLIDTSAKILMCLFHLSKTVMDSREKLRLTNEIETLAADYAQKTNSNVHYAGLPWLRSYIQGHLPKELVFFMVLAILLTAISLYLFYRSFYAVIFPIILLLSSAICTYGIIGLLGYKLNLLTALLPPIIVILGIPPSIYMLSDYHEEFVKCKNKIQALHYIIRKLGLVTFMINANTAFGFLTLYFTNVTMLQEFGIVAFLSTMLAYLLSIILIPGVFSLLPPPTENRLKHLDFTLFKKLVNWVDYQVSNHGNIVIVTSLLILVVSTFGIFNLKTVAYMVDDLPQTGQFMTDLRFIETHFNGAMPFEICIDTRKPNGVRKLSFLKKLDQLQEKLSKYPDLSRTLSLADGLKWGRQAMYNGSAVEYQLPNRDELPFLLSMIAGKKETTNENKIPALQTMVDTNYQKIRISAFVKDVGSLKMAALIKQLRADIDSIFPPANTAFNQTEKETPTYQTLITGTTKVFLKANDILIENLVWSLIAVFVLIGLQMLFLFKSFKIMIISMIPNLIPLAVTAGIMGWFGIPIKPSTALIYELAFGIAIDNSIHFLSVYRWQRLNYGLQVNDAISTTIRTTGTNILYTSLVLLSGFLIFVFSAFGSTQALGILTSVTLLIALFSNLLLMPVLLRIM